MSNGVRAVNTLPPWLAGRPWHLPLAQWPDTQALPAGRSRHVLRRISTAAGDMVVKETPGATHDFAVLTHLSTSGVPVTPPEVVATNRISPTGAALPDALVTHWIHAQSVYEICAGAGPGAAGEADDEAWLTGMVEALARLLARVHEARVFWGDASLANALFSVDGDFTAHLVDVETAEVHPVLSDSMRDYDCDLACRSLTGDLLDLHAAGLLRPGGEEAAALATQLAHQLKVTYTNRS